MSEDENNVVRRKPVWTLGAFCAVLLLGAGSAATAQNTVEAPGCGLDKEHFDVKTTKRQHPETKEDADKAVVYFLQDDREFESTPKPVVRLGIDGKWIGATHGTSYLVTTVEPGEHHLCASWQTNVTIGAHKQSGALHFTAEAGKVYFFSAQDRWLREHGAKPMKFEELDSDQGKLLIRQFAFATSQPKK
jgi:hypothetical protein